MTSRKNPLRLDTPNVRNLIDLLTNAFAQASKPKALSHISKLQPWFSGDWGGIAVLNEHADGEHFWLGIWWDEPCSLRFEFAPALYKRERMPLATSPEKMDWWPYVRFPLTPKFLHKSRERQSADILNFVEDTLKALDHARQF